jgi:hypothetical protein
MHARYARMMHERLSPLLEGGVGGHRVWHATDDRDRELAAEGEAAARGELDAIRSNRLPARLAAYSTLRLLSLHKYEKIG